MQSYDKKFNHWGDYLVKYFLTLRFGSVERPKRYTSNRNSTTFLYVCCLASFFLLIIKSVILEFRLLISSSIKQNYL